MRLLQERKNELLKEINAYFGIFGIAIPLHDDEMNGPDIKMPREIVVDKTDTGKTVVFTTKSIGYDFMVQMPIGRLFGKILISPRNFGSNGAIATRYENFLTTTVSTIKNLTQKADIWILFINTPKKWEYFIVPLDEFQLFLTEEIFTKIRESSSRMRFYKEFQREYDELLNHSEVAQDTILLQFLTYWIIFHKSNNGLLYK